MSKTERLKELVHALVAEQLSKIETENLSIDNLQVSNDFTIGVNVSFNLLVHLR